MLRDQLLGQLEEINSAEDAATWAHRILPAKNRLNAANAQQVETAFEAKLKNLQGEAEVGEVRPSAPSSASQHSSNLNPPIFPPTRSTNQENIESGHFVRVRSRRVRDKEHLRFVAKQPCLICGRTPADAHHLRFAQHHALSQKVSDEFTVPLCRGHHREVHRYGNEAEWWKRTTIDPAITARVLWLKTHPPLVRAQQIEAVGLMSGVARGSTPKALDYVSVRIRKRPHNAYFTERKKDKPALKHFGAPKRAPARQRRY